MQEPMITQKLREAFLNYFKKLGHEIVPGSSLIPAHDPTLLFTNSGMVQFKDVFLGLEQKPFTRAVTVQRCMRAGGKHNDLENVGYTARHHTFFEMLGNFSFGDYFKREAIHDAWRFLTGELQIPEHRLWVSVYRSDKESEQIWLDDIKVDPERFSRCGESDNFWQMGETGPCGPCTEIFYDHGEHIAGGPPGSSESEGDRYVEIWNLVFMQYNKNLDGKLTPLPKKCVDTGMGLERLSAVIEGVHDNYDIQLFRTLLQALSQQIGYEDLHDTSMRVIVDHIRSSAFLIMDGVVPSNEGRGYILRRIIRRAVRHGHKLGQQRPFFYKLSGPLIEVMQDAYPELKKLHPVISSLIEQEEHQFSKTLSKGLKILDHALEKLSGREIPGELIFQLYDTYGFPPDLTADIARERGYSLDYASFNKAMEHQREQSQQAQQFTLDHGQKHYVGGTTHFTGYDSLTSESKIIALLHEDKPVSELKAGEKGVVVLDVTPFYAESGGQVGDKGYLYFDDGSFHVKDTQKRGSVYLHIGEIVKGVLHNKMHVNAKVDASRQDIALNHSATHLLHEALRRILGEHILQKGSLVEARRLRFDFSHIKPLTPAEIQSVEDLVNQQIRANLVSEVTEMSIDEAKKQGAMALFGERYGDRVRVLKMGDFSTEICGGTHVKRTGEIGLFKIISETACAAGVRRIEALTGQAALEYVQTEERDLLAVGELLNTPVKNIPHRIQQLFDTVNQLEKRLKAFEHSLNQEEVEKLVRQAADVKGLKVVAAEVFFADRDRLRDLTERLKDRWGEFAIILASIHNGRVNLIARLSPKSSKHFTAVELLNHVAQQVNGKGGGKFDRAEGGGDQPKHLQQALHSVAKWVEERMH